MNINDDHGNTETPYTCSLVHSYIFPHGEIHDMIMGKISMIFYITVSERFWGLPPQCFAKQLVSFPARPMAMYHVCFIYYEITLRMKFITSHHIQGRNRSIKIYKSSRELRIVITVFVIF